MYSFRKSKRGFTLIELMVVVVIIGILALLGLRLYLTQIAKANDALIKANAGTIQTTIQAALADEAGSAVAIRWVDPETAGIDDLLTESGIHNPMTKLPQAAAPAVRDTGAAGEVWVVYDASDAIFYINGRNAAGDDNVYLTTDLVAKY